MNVPQLTAAAALSYLVFENMRANNAKDLSRQTFSPGLLKTGCNQRWCPSTGTVSQLWIDTPTNTVLRDDSSMIEPTLQGAAQYLRDQYRAESAAHPGVNLVAHTVA